MLPQSHFLFGFIFGGILYIFFSQIGILNFFIFLIATIFIDIDHYIYYICKEKKYGFVNAIKWFLKKRKILGKMSTKKYNSFYSSFYFLHGIELLISFLILGYFISDIFYFVALGIGFHLTLDYIDQIRRGIRVDKLSVFHDYFKYKKLKLLKVSDFKRIK